MEVTSLADMLSLDNVQIVDEIPDWEEAVRVSLKPLIENGFAEPRYVDNIIAQTKELGPYWVLTEDVGLVHGRPEDGAIKKQLGVTISKKPVIFDENTFPVRVFFALTAEDSESHVEAIQLIASYCMDPEQLDKLVHAETAEEAYQLLTAASAS